MATKTKVKRRELVQLADKYKAGKSKIAGWYVSEKLDGSRCLWDGGITRGMNTVDVPWAGLLHPKKFTPKPKIKPKSTGLWSRYGNPIIAPDWFLDALPKVPLDGELWCGRGNFQTCRSIVAGDTPDPRWDQVQYAVYGSPGMINFTEPGLIKNNSMYCEIPEDTLQFVMELGSKFLIDATFVDEYEHFAELLEDSTVAFAHLQRSLPTDEVEAAARLEEIMNDVVEGGGEGVIIRDGAATYLCKRSKQLLKYKPYDDGDGKLVGFTAGRVGKYEGMIGALILELDNGKRLELSGMTDAERMFCGGEVGHCEPGKDLPAHVTRSAKFVLGERISFLYRELSDDGIPKEARYFRQRGDV
jgi:DNA ligase-1